MDSFKYDIPNGLHIFHKRSDETIRCDDCNSWADVPRNIRHRSSCDTRDLQVEWLSSDNGPTFASASGVELPCVSEGGAIDWSRIRRGSREYEAAMDELGHGGGNFDLI